MSPRPSVEVERRHEMLTAACRLIAERGYAAVRMSDVADLAGTSRSAVHYYFHDRETLLEQALVFAMEQSAARHKPALAATEDPRERLLRLIDLYLPTSEEAIAWQVYLRFWDAALTNPDLRAFQADIYGNWRRLIANVIAAGQAARVVRRGDADDMASELAALIDGLAIQTVLESPDMPIERMRRLGRARIEEWFEDPATAVDGPNERNAAQR
jgi:AcrR family transcriptional regulator